MPVTDSANCNDSCDTSAYESDFRSSEDTKRQLQRRRQWRRNMAIRQYRSQTNSGIFKQLHRMMYYFVASTMASCLTKFPASGKTWG